MSLAGILTFAQVNAMQAIMTVAGDGYSFMAPRYVIVPDGVVRNREWNEDWSRVLLLVGAPDPMMDDCDCDGDHIMYSLVRSDGETTEPITSGTLLEALIIPDDAQWDMARPVTIDMWPTPNVPDTIPGM